MKVSPSHQPHLPHVPLPSARRIRPPRIPKGTPNGSLLPQPPGSVPKNRVWVQGKWRNPASNASKDRQILESKWIEKAMRHEHHGSDIYAYNHIRTHQVVYSFTRILNNNSVLEQLVFHGKKTVPATLRRDHWTPYFSVHFPKNEYGSASGLLAYRYLRELSLKRQLSPTKKMVSTTQEHVDNTIARYDPLDFDREKEEGTIKLPIVGQLLPRKMRAKLLMDQKATAVADLAFALRKYAGRPGPKQAMGVRERQRAERELRLTKGGRKRLRKSREVEKAIEKRIEERAKMIQAVRQGALDLDLHAAKRLSMEYGAEVNTKATARTKFKLLEAGDASEATSAKDALNSTENTAQKGQSQRPAPVLVLWADPRDAAFAAKWPTEVEHGELAPYAISRVRFDGGKKEVSKSVHVMGHHKNSPWYDMRYIDDADAAISGSGNDKPGVSDSSSSTGAKEREAELLQDEGIEIQPPKRGVLDRVKGLFGFGGRPSPPAAAA